MQLEPNIVPPVQPIAQSQSEQAPAAKKPWKTPRVIKSEMRETETGAGPGTDGIAALTS